MDKITKTTKQRGYTIRERLNRYADKSVSDSRNKGDSLDVPLNKAPKDVSPAMHFLHRSDHYSDPFVKKDPMPGVLNNKPKSYKMRGVI